MICSDCAVPWNDGQTLLTAVGALHQGGILAFLGGALSDIAELPGDGELVGIERLRDPPTEWSRQFEALGLNPE